MTCLSALIFHSLLAAAAVCAEQQQEGEARIVAPVAHLTYASGFSSADRAAALLACPACGPSANGLELGADFCAPRYQALNFRGNFGTASFTEMLLARAPSKQRMSYTSAHKVLGTVDVSSGVQGGLAAAAGAAVAAPPEPPLPSDWSQHYDATSQKYYYHNATTNDTVWTRPLV